MLVHLLCVYLMPISNCGLVYLHTVIIITHSDYNNVKNHFIIVDLAVFLLVYRPTMYTQSFFIVHAHTHTGLTMHASILAYMFSLVEDNKISAPLFDPSSVQAANNAIYIQEYVAQLLKQAFPHLQE